MTNDNITTTTHEARPIQPDETSLAITIENWLKSGNREELQQLLKSHHEVDVAQALAALPTEEALAVFRGMNVESRANLFAYLPVPFQITLSRLMSRRELAVIIAAMSHDERADVFKNLNEKEQENLLPALAQAEREDLLKLASYPEGTAGSVMTSDYAALSRDLTAHAALEELRIQASDTETIYLAYVVDEDRHLLGTVSLRDLLLARPGEKVSDLMTTKIVYTSADQPQEEAVRLISRYDLIALPVTDGSGKLLGIVTQDDAMDLQEEEATEDFHLSGTVQKLSTSVRQANIFNLYRARVFWLVLLVFGNVFSGLGIAYFEDTISAYVVLVFFLPLLIGSGGNAGSQSATLMVRAIATGDVRFSDWGLMIGREVLVAGLLGLTMAFAVSFLGFIRGGLEVALVVASSMIIIVLVGSLVGISLPFLLARLKLDPATASAPLVTSIADASGVIIYFTIATYILQLG